MCRGSGATRPPSLDVVWVTIVREVFADSEREEVRSALEEIADPRDNYGWSSAGIYVFWAPTSRQVLYIGMAVDLPERFGQHTGLVGADARGNKRDEINAWFQSEPLLGYSVLLQTPNIQPVGHRLTAHLGVTIAEAGEDPYLEVDPLPHELQDYEGRLIEHHRLSFGDRPPWNRVGGAVAGAEQVQGVGPDDLFGVVTGPLGGLLVARRPLRQLAAEPISVEYELHLHTARLQATMFGVPGSVVGPEQLWDAVERVSGTAPETAHRMQADAYLQQRAPFSD